MHCRHEDMLAVYNRHLLLSESPVVRPRVRQQQHTPMPDTPRSGISSAYDLEDSFLAGGKCKHVLLPCLSVGVLLTLNMHLSLHRGLHLTFTVLQLLTIAPSLAPCVLLPHIVVWCSQHELV